MKPVNPAHILLAACLAAPCAFAAGTETLELDPLLAAKVAKEKAKAGAASAKAGGKADKAGGKGDCGVNIGNVDSGKAGPGQRPLIGPRENTVVITGPVINLGKCK